MDATKVLRCSLVSMALHSRAPDYDTDDWEALDNLSSAVLHLIAHCLTLGLLDLKQINEVWEEYEHRATEKDARRVDTMKLVFESLAKQHNVNIYRYSPKGDAQKVRFYSQSCARHFVASVGMRIIAKQEVPLPADVWREIRMFLMHTVIFIDRLVQDDIVDVQKADHKTILNYTLGALRFAKTLVEELPSDGATLH